MVFIRARTEAMRLYVNDIDHFIRTYTDMHTPLIVMGEEKLVAYFKNKTRRPDKILAEIHGSYDNEKTTVIRDRIKEKIAAYMQKRDQKLLKRIQPDIDRLSYVSGIQEAWQVAAMKEARVLLVEQDYAVEGYSVKDGLFLVFSQPQDEEYDYHADAIDDLAEMVLLQGGEVYFVAPGLLSQYDKITKPAVAVVDLPCRLICQAEQVAPAGRVYPHHPGNNQAHQALRHLAGRIVGLHCQLVFAGLPQLPGGLQHRLFKVGIGQHLALPPAHDILELAAGLQAMVIYPVQHFALDGSGRHIAVGLAVALGVRP